MGRRAQVAQSYLGRRPCGAGRTDQVSLGSVRDMVLASGRDALEGWFLGVLPGFFFGVGEAAPGVDPVVDVALVGDAVGWQSLIVTLEDALRLHRHQPGTLTVLDRYLHQRTGGMIGSLSRLIRGAAIEAILDGGEQITKKLLDTIDIDHAAETAAREKTRHR